MTKLTGGTKPPPAHPYYHTRSEEFDTDYPLPPLQSIPRLTREVAAREVNIHDAVTPPADTRPVVPRRTRRIRSPPPPAPSASGGKKRKTEKRKTEKRKTEKRKTRK